MLWCMVDFQKRVNASLSADRGKKSSPLNGWDGIIRPVLFSSIQFSCFCAFRGKKNLLIALQQDIPTQKTPEPALSFQSASCLFHEPRKAQKARTDFINYSLYSNFIRCKHTEIKSYIIQHSNKLLITVPTTAYRIRGSISIKILDTPVLMYSSSIKFGCPGFAGSGLLISPISCKLDSSMDSVGL